MNKYEQLGFIKVGFSKYKLREWILTVYYDYDFPVGTFLLYNSLINKGELYVNLDEVLICIGIKKIKLI